MVGRLLEWLYPLVSEEASVLGHFGYHACPFVQRVHLIRLEERFALEKVVEFCEVILRVGCMVHQHHVEVFHRCFLDLVDPFYHLSDPRVYSLFRLPLPLQTSPDCALWLLLGRAIRAKPLGVLVARVLKATKLVGPVQAPRVYLELFVVDIRGAPCLPPGTSDTGIPAPNTCRQLPRLDLHLLYQLLEELLFRRAPLLLADPVPFLVLRFSEREELLGAPPLQSISGLVLAGLVVLPLLAVPLLSLLMLEKLGVEMAFALGFLQLPSHLLFLAPDVDPYL